MSKESRVTLMPFRNFIGNSRVLLITEGAGEYYSKIFQIGVEHLFWFRPEICEQPLSEYERIVQKDWLVELSYHSLPALGSEPRTYHLNRQGYQGLRKDYAKMLSKINIKAKYPHKRGKGFRTRRMTVKDLDALFSIYFEALMANMDRAIKQEKNQISKHRDNIAYIRELKKKHSR